MAPSVLPCSLAASTPSATALASLSPSHSVEASVTPSVSVSAQAPVPSEAQLGDNCHVLTPSQDAVLYWPNRQVFNGHTETSHHALEDVWEVKFCAGAGRVGVSGCVGCSGSLVVTRLLGCPGAATANGVSPDESTRQLADTIGPDELYVVVEGAEFLVPLQQHTGDCVYTFPITATVPGKYRVSVTVQRSDWDGAAEVSKEKWPPLTLDQLLGSFVFIQLGSGDTDAALTTLRDAHAALPACTGSAVFHGRYVRTSPVGNLLNGSRLPSFQRKPGFDDNIRYYTNLHTDVEWLPYSCSRHVPAEDAAVACFARRKVRMVGDSHTRVLFNYMARRMCGLPSAAVKGFDRKCLSELTGLPPQCRGLDLCYVFDPAGSMVGKVAAELGQRDILTLNFGQHFLNRHSSMPQAQQYAARVAENLASWRQAPASATAKLFWMDVPAFPTRIDNWVVNDYKDARTLTRLRMFNAVARARVAAAVAEGAVAGILLTFDELLVPMMDASKDSAHLVDFDPALGPQYETLTQLVCDA